jgi:hypothetical protein
VYRFTIANPNAGTLDWIIDPFAREFGAGKLSAFTLGYQPYVWSAAEDQWRTPALADLILYEMNIAEFGSDLDRARTVVAYLADLGINVIEIMPLSNVGTSVDWGYLPIDYFGVDERFGKRSDFQQLVAKIAQGQRYWNRFDAGAGKPLGLVQMAEQLEGPEEVLRTTYSNSTWQNGTFDAARAVARGDRGRLADLGLRLGLFGYPDREVLNGDDIPKAGLQ